VFAQSWQAKGMLAPIASPIRSSRLRRRLVRRRSAKLQPAISRSNHLLIDPSIGTAPPKHGARE